MRYLVVILLLFISCRNTENKEEIDIELFKDVIGVLIPDVIQSKYIIILPSDGCSGCDIFVIKKLYEKIDKIDRSDFQIIISGIHGKLIIDESGISALDFKIIEDREANVIRYGLVSIYPKIFKISNDNVQSWEIRAPTREQDFKNFFNQL